MEQLSLLTNTIHQIDCFEGLRLIPDHSIDLILTDPPYGVTACPWDKAPNLDALWREFKRVITPNGAVIITATQPFATDVINANRKWFRYDLLWVKNISVGFLNAKKMPLRQHELVLVFYAKLPVYNPQKTPGRLYKSKGKDLAAGVYRALKAVDTVSDTRYPTSVLSFSKDSGPGKKHPTQKPVALFQWLVKSYSNPGQIVLDPYMGSGTTAIAAKREGRRFLGFETDLTYHQMAIGRLLKEDKLVQ